MQLRAPTPPPVSVWWINLSWLLIGVVIALVVLSQVLRQWLPHVKVSAWMRRRALRNRREIRLGRSVTERVVTGGVRFLSNTSLVLGSLILLVLIVAAVAPQTLAPYEKDLDIGRFLQMVEGELRAPPIPPSPPYPLGTDHQGRDVLTQIIYGTRLTVGLALAATALRLAIGVGLGGISGWKQSGLSQQILSLSAVSASVPSLLFAYIFIVSIGPQEGFGVFLLGLALTGWAELTNLVNGAIAWIKAQPYMEGARTLGSSPGHLIRRHVFPNLAPQLLPAFALELSAAMLILAELGFIGIVFGERAPTSIPQSLRVVQAAEWGGMLSGSRLLLFNKPWLPLMPALAFLVAILGFNLFGIGLRGWLDPYRSS